MDAFDATPLCPSPVELALGSVRFDAGALIVTALSRRRVVACPVCGHSARRVHSRYQRTVADLPWHGLQVQFTLSVRRFFCERAMCPRRIFTERFPATVDSYGRRTIRAAATLEAIGFALGGRPAARLAALLGLRAGPATILAQIGRTYREAPPTPRVLGVDDWSMRRGTTYGTLLVDLERRVPIDLLPDRRAETLATWLRAHPGVELITRDRGGAYADGARGGAPEAIQIADRFHLMHNLVDALTHMCTRHAPALRSAAAAIGSRTREPSLDRGVGDEIAGVHRAPPGRRVSGLPNNAGGPTRQQQRSLDRRARRVGRYEEVVALRARGMSRRAIAQHLRLDRRTVATWLAAGEFPERATREPLPRLTDPHLVWLTERVRQGVSNGSQLARELRDHGYTGSTASVRRTVRRLQRSIGPMDGGGSTSMLAPALPRSLRSPRTTAFLLRRPQDELSPTEKVYLSALDAACPPIAAARASAESFRVMFATRDPNALEPWLAQAATTELRSFAAGIRRDRDAVLAAIVFPWSNGQVEGHVGRLKLLKRSMYGRCGFPLLRQRVLHHAS